MAASLYFVIQDFWVKCHDFVLFSLTLIQSKGETKWKFCYIVRENMVGGSLRHVNFKNSYKTNQPILYITLRIV